MQDEAQIMTKRKQTILVIIDILIPIILICACTYLYQLTNWDKIRTIFSGSIFVLLTQFSMYRSRIAEDFLFPEVDNSVRFRITYPVLFGFGCIFPLFMSQGWPFLFLAVVLVLFSNFMTALTAYTSILITTCMLSGFESNIFLVYFITGVVACILFSAVDENFHAEIPMFLSLFVFLASISAHIIITQNANLNFEMFLVPMINFFLCMVLIFMFFFFMNHVVLVTQKDLYAELNDSESELMIRIRETREESYFHAFHTAYLCNKIACRLNLDPNALRTAAFYREAGIVNGANNDENLFSVCKEYGIPEEAIRILKEYRGQGPMISKENTILTMSAVVIDTIMHLIAEKPDSKLDYRAIIELLFERKMNKKAFDQSTMTLGELNLMKKILMEENLYYDFLR